MLSGIWPLWDVPFNLIQTLALQLREALSSSKATSWLLWLTMRPQAPKNHSKQYKNLSGSLTNDFNLLQSVSMCAYKKRTKLSRRCRDVAKQAIFNICVTGSRLAVGQDSHSKHERSKTLMRKSENEIHWLFIASVVQ